MIDDSSTHIGELQAGVVLGVVGEGGRTRALVVLTVAPLQVTARVADSPSELSNVIIILTDVTINI